MATTATGMTGMGMGHGMSNPMFAMRQTINHYVIEWLGVDNSLMGMFATFLVMSLVGAIVTNLQKLPTFISSLFTGGWKGFKKTLQWIYVLMKKKKNTVIKKMVIQKITDERKMNPLYQPLVWYLTNQVDLDEEPSLKFMTDSKIDNRTEKIPQLFKRIDQNSVREMEYQGRKISYRLSDTKIKVDGEDADRRNDIVECWTECLNKEDDVLEDFTRNCMELYMNYIKTKDNKRKVYQNMDGKWQVVSSQPDELKDTIVLRNRDKDYLFEEVNHFIDDKNWYIDHGIPYALGVLLYGNPGCGKTTIIRYISYLTGRNTHYLRLTQIRSENEFNQLLKGLDLKRTVLVLEDVDCAGKITHKREYPNTEEEPVKVATEPSTKVDETNGITIVMNSMPEQKKKDVEKDAQSQLTLDTLLNILDGVLTVEGQIVIMTTNHVEILDEALIRPGRIDIRLELALCDHDMIKQLYMNFYRAMELDLDEEEMISKVPEDHYTPAYVVNTFRKHRNNSDEGLEELMQ